MSDRRITSEDVRKIVGNLEDATLVDVLATGATVAELTEAWEWLGADDVIGEERQHPAGGRVAMLCDILSRDDIDPDIA